MKPKFYWLVLSLLISPLAVSFASGQDKVDFVTEIKPIFEKHCMECHNENGDQYPIELKDDAFYHITAGDPEDSELYRVLVSDDEDVVMPPPDFERPLVKEQVNLVKRWIAEGADWPADATFTMWKPEMNSQDDEAGTSETSKDDAVVPGIDPRVYRAAGSLHPAVIHLPMGLLLAAGFFAFLGLRGNFVMSDCAYYCLWLGALTAVVGCVTGWYFSESKGTGTVVEFMDIFDQEQEVFWHRISALGCTIFAVLLGLFAMSARSRDPDEGVVWKFGAIILAAGIGYVGMTGGKLVYPSNHYKDLNSLWSEMIGGAGLDAPSLEGEAKDDQPKADMQDAPVDDADTSEVI